MRIAGAGTSAWHWAVLRHPARGVVARDNVDDAIWRVARTFDVPVRITDRGGRPVPGARLGFCAGGGHAPDLVTAIADTDGVAVLRGIDPGSSMRDLYVQHPGLQLGGEALDWLPGGSPMELRCEPGPVVAGSLLDASGAPVGGAHVCIGSRHRGPWGRTAPDGSFTVLGGAPDDYPHKVVTAAGTVVSFPRPATLPVTLRLPERLDGPFADGTIDGPHHEPPEPEPDSPTREIRLRVRNGPRRLAWALEQDGPWQFAGDPERALTIPARGPVVIWLLDKERSDDDSADHEAARRYAFADAAALADPLELAWQPSVVITGRAVDADGEPVPIRARVRGDFAPVARDAEAGARWHAFPTGSFTLPRDREGLAFVEIEPQDAALRGRRVFVNVPARGSADEAQLGDVEVGGPPQLVLRDAAGKPLRDAVVGWQRAGFQEAGSASEWPLDRRGEWHGPDLQAGDVIVVPGDAQRLPCRFELTGDGPFECTLPDGQLDLGISDERGNALDATVTFLDQWEYARNGGLSLRGLRHGPLRLFVAAEGHASAVVDTVVTACTKTVRLVLPSRP